MATCSVKFFPILLLAWGTITLTLSAPEIGLHALTFLGSVDGKSYYLEKIATNWTLSKQRCEGAGMHLATFTNLSQINLLKSHYNITSYWYYWIGARDSETPAQFVWDHNNGTLNSSLFTGYNREVGIQTCVAYKADSATAASFHFRSCSRVTCYTLCEIIHH